MDDGNLTMKERLRPREGKGGSRDQKTGSENSIEKIRRKKNLDFFNPVKELLIQPITQIWDL